MDSIWCDYNWASLLESREAETGEWLGADVLFEPGVDDYMPEA